jgi:hypothetical protein
MDGFIIFFLTLRNLTDTLRPVKVPIEGLGFSDSAETEEDTLGDLAIPSF